MSSDETVSGPLWVLGGLAFFFVLNQLLRLVIPLSARNSAKQQWKWKNTSISLAHSVITGTWALFCIYEHPKLAEDLIDTYTPSSHILISFSVGYFIHDFFDMALCHRKRSSYELMVHHACCICCFGLAVWTGMFIGYAVVSLFVEVNSVFLHIRQLLIITGVGKEEVRYRISSMLNIGTFAIFRIAVLGWMTRWIVLHKDDLSLPVYTLGSVVLAVIMLMSIVLFCRICIVDFTKKKQRDHTMVADNTHKRKVKEAEEAPSGMSGKTTLQAAKLYSNATNVHLD
ncbi:TLC domain-containing protein 2-like isoform X1 [Macrobrachium nipponense]|uniref:TLC domain-containing protein 2-like isoform X1 n=2 Tax=Macrobrachium nipponense TaxID=159736 RepID=UPI0030C84BB0